MKQFDNRWYRVWLAVIIASVTAFWIPKTAQAQYISLPAYLSIIYRIRYPILVPRLAVARDLNGISLNGRYLDEQYITGVSLDDVVVKHGRKTVSLKLRGTRFDHLPRIEGAVFTATVDDGSLLSIRIDAVSKVRHRRDWDVIHYYASYETDTGFEPLCGLDDNGDPIGAIPLSGRWDYTQGTDTGGSHIADPRAFTFACEGYVLHKCVEAGYKPWQSVLVCWDKWDCEMISLAPYHQACTRMMRADFCGTGVSYTEDGIMIGLYDSLGIRIDTEEWEFEAEWDEDGAICAQSERIEGMLPECAPYLQDDTCGDKSHLFDGALIMSEIP